MIALQIIDNFLLQYNVGQALLFLFVIAVLASVIVLRSRRVLAIQFVTFGVLYMLTPQSLLVAPYWKFIGIGLAVLGPTVYMTAPRE